MSGETVAETYHVERCEQDRYAAESHRRAAHATREGWFRDEILPVSVPQKKGAPIVVDRDESIREDTSEASLGALKPAFKKDGTVTAGNAPGVNDGAAAVVVMRRTSPPSSVANPMNTKTGSSVFPTPRYRFNPPAGYTSVAVNRASISGYSAASCAPSTRSDASASATDTAGFRRPNRSNRAALRSFAMPAWPCPAGR